MRTSFVSPVMAWIPVGLSLLVISGQASGTDFSDSVNITTAGAFPLHLKDSASETRIEILSPDGQAGFNRWVVGPHSFNFAINGPNDKDIFKIKPQAPANTLLLDNNGNIGIGSFAPLAALHIERQLDATLRLETTGDGGVIPAQTWDLSASSLEFVLVDNNTGLVPFGIESGSPDNLLYLTGSGRIGMGTRSPATLIHARQAAAANVAETIARFNVSDDSVGRLEINNATATDGLLIPRLQGRSNSQNAALIMEAQITNDLGGNPCIVYNTSKIAGGEVVTRPLVVYRNNNVAKVTIASNGNVTATAFVNASSRELKDKIADLSSDKASAALRQLTPVEFVYKDDASADPRIGFIAEDVPDLIAEPERKSVPVMDLVAVLTRVVKDQDRQLHDQQQQLAVERQRNDRNEKLLLELSRQMGELKDRVRD